MERHQDGVINNRQDITCRPRVTGLSGEAIVWDVQLKVLSWRDKSNPHSCRPAPTQPLQWISCCFVMLLGWQPARLIPVSAKCWESPSILRTEIQVLFPQNILHLFVSSQEFSFPCFLSSFLIFPGQLGSFFHTTFKILKSYLKWVCSLAIEIFHLKLPFTQLSLLHTDHSLLSMGSAIQHFTCLWWYYTIPHKSFPHGVQVSLFTDSTMLAPTLQQWKQIS